MKNVKLNHWYVNNNTMSIGLMKYYASINMVLLNNKICFVLEIINDQRKSIYLSFESLEDAISFTEDVINNYSITFDDIEEEYKRKYSDVKKKIK